MTRKPSITGILDKITPEEEDYFSWVILFTWGIAMGVQRLADYFFGNWAGIIPFLVVLAGCLGVMYNLRNNDSNGDGPHS